MTRWNLKISAGIKWDYNEVGTSNFTFEQPFMNAVKWDMPVTCDRLLIDVNS